MKPEDNNFQKTADQIRDSVSIRGERKEQVGEDRRGHGPKEAGAKDPGEFPSYFHFGQKDPTPGKARKRNKPVPRKAIILFSSRPPHSFPARGISRAGE